MNEIVKDKFPDWCQNRNHEFSLCLTDDLDSFLSCVVLEGLTNSRIGYFFDFENMYYVDDVDDNRDMLGVDLDLCCGRAWGNHTTAIRNSDAANLNTVLNVRPKRYFQKYAGNTILTILSYYGTDINVYTKEQKMVLLSIDGGYKGLYDNRFRTIQKHYLDDVLEYPELTALTERHKINDFYKTIDKYNLCGKIYMSNNGYLKTDIKLEALSELFGSNFSLPKEHFTASKMHFRNTPLKLTEFKRKFNPLVFYSDALTNRNFIKASELC